jgi:hypothetical protein
MVSIVPGYEYDIFISYRQKDNKGDRWVSEFVEALKTELEWFEKRAIKNPPGNPPGFMKISDNLCKMKNRK